MLFRSSGSWASATTGAGVVVGWSALALVDEDGSSGVGVEFGAGFGVGIVGWSVSLLTETAMVVSGEFSADDDDLETRDDPRLGLQRTKSAPMASRSAFT